MRLKPLRGINTSVSVGGYGENNCKPQCVLEIFSETQDFALRSVINVTASCRLQRFEVKNTTEFLDKKSSVSLELWIQ